MGQTDHQTGSGQEEPDPQSTLCVPEREMMRGFHLITEEGQAPYTLHGVDLETLLAALREDDPGLVQGHIPAPLGVVRDGLGVSPVQIATEVYGPARGTSGRRVAGD